MTRHYCILLKLLAIVAFATFNTTIKAQDVLIDGTTNNDDDSLAVDTMAVDSLGNLDLPEDSIAQHLPWEEAVRLRLQSLLTDRLFETSQVALMVWDLDADSVLFRHNERQRMRPASTMKLLTAISALDYLGSGYKLRTELRYRGNMNDSTRIINGNLYCIGCLDPEFSSLDVNVFADSIKSLNADTIVGNIYADMSFKDNDRLGEGWCWDDDNPVLSPLLVNGKDRFVESLLRSLRERNIVLDGTCKEQSTSTNGGTILCCIERPLTALLGKMMKKSNNLYAEAVFYQIAHRQGGSHAGAASARSRMDMVVKKAGGDHKALRVADGSGLSLYNYATAEIEVMMLRYAFNNNDIYPYLYESLPIAGIDGTLRKRMRNSKAKANVRAKTGTLKGVCTLAGYCTGGNGHKLCFAIFNQGIKDSSEARNFQDKVCRVLCSD